MRVAKVLGKSVGLAVAIVIAGVALPWERLFTVEYNTASLPFPLLPKVGERIIVQDAARSLIDLTKVDRVIWLPECSSCSLAQWSRASFSAIKDKARVVLVAKDPLGELEGHFQYKGFSEFRAIVSPLKLRPENSPSPMGFFGARIKAGIIEKVASTPVEVLSL